mmetsp:Transcript_2759/g.4609  ORF Transcript_2759/g.4609 Transcript_2759/m.4609 type:complete len:607 (-) Transcript_2759:51-1871(-)
MASSPAGAPGSSGTAAQAPSARNASPEDEDEVLRLAAESEVHQEPAIEPAMVSSARGAQSAGCAGLDLDALGSNDGVLAEGDVQSANGSPNKEIGTEANQRRLSAVKGEGAECSICFGPLPTEPVCVFIRHIYGKKRTCRHYFHLGCVQLMMRQTPAPYLCPLCRGQFERVEAMPDVRLNSRAWFKTVDTDEGGALEKSEVIDALSATLPVDPELLSKNLEGELWDQWDPGRTGRITLEAFEQPGKGLLHFVLYSLPSLRFEGGSGNQTSAVPDMIESREGWFRYWDENCRHMLEFLQFLRALVLTWRLDGAKEDAGILRSVLATVWQEFGLTESNKDVLKPVSFALFCEKPDGFCDALVDALQKRFGAAKFRRIRQRARLLQQPAAALKRELRKLNAQLPDAIEKDELVTAILDAQAEEQPASPVLQPVQATSLSSTPEQRSGGDRICAEELKALSLKELQHRLKALAVPYGHCLEREELEDLLMEHGDRGSGPLPAPAVARPQSPSAQPARRRPCQPGSPESVSGPGQPSSPSSAARNGSPSAPSSPSAASQRPTSANSSTRSSGQRPARSPHPNQPIPTVTEPPPPDDAVRLRRCGKGACDVQ